MTSLYIHIPWCIKKCPYCDFNSHQKGSDFEEMTYVRALIADLDADLAWMPKFSLDTIFIGGGTPSLFTAKAYEVLFDAIACRLPFAKEIEITLEANPGTFEFQRFCNYRKVGINRLSLGIQSFNASHLKALGRIHHGEDAKSAIIAARRAGFHNINLDIMHGLPKQTVDEGLQDLKTALTYEPEHLSWYELTLEPNTVFYKKPPMLPKESVKISLEQTGFQILADAKYVRYEISAFSKPHCQSRHNLNYWQFGDYYGVGAGAHGKITLADGVKIRTEKRRNPRSYLDPSKPFLVKKIRLSQANLLFEWVLNVTRLEGPIAKTLLVEKTGLSWEYGQKLFENAAALGLLHLSEHHFQVTEKGRWFTNDLQAIFLPSEGSSSQEL